jgi:5-methylcytosine-specific restriction endonuclease McrA
MGKSANARAKAFFQKAIAEGRSFRMSCWVCRTVGEHLYATRWSVGERACKKCGADLHPPKKVSRMWEIANQPKPAKARRAPKAVVYAEYIRSPEWAKVRVRKLREVGWKCERCGRKKHLQAHHLTYERLGRERLSDLEICCRGCHSREHGCWIQANRHLDAITGGWA